MAYSKTKDLIKRTQSDNVLKDKTFKISSDPKYDGYQRRLASMVYKFFDKKSKGSGIATNEPNYQLEFGTFTKNKERIEKFMQTGNTDFVYKNELDKACFQHDMAYGKSNNLIKRT